MSVPTIPRVFCIGRNYCKHAKELDNPLPEEPVVFMKPPASILSPGEPIILPDYAENMQYEAELVMKMGNRGKNISKNRATDYIDGLALGLDLTLRNIQRELKDKGLPWEKAKSFEGSAAIGDFIPFTEDMLADRMKFICRINGEIRQRGKTEDMIFSLESLIEYLSSRWELLEGDIIFTGTPDGVGPLDRGDIVTLEGEPFEKEQWKVKQEK